MMASEPGQTLTPPHFLVLSDSPAMDGTDPLEFEAMAGRLERIIVASRTSAPFTASIEAGWGAGKSTLMRRVQRRLQGKAPDQHRAPTDARTVWFNAWTAPEAQVLEGLVRSVLDQLDSNLLRRVARKRKLVSGLGLGVSVLAGFFGLGNVVDRVWEKVSIDPKQRNELNEFVREAMEKWLAKSSRDGRLIVVFIDDLDRCSSVTVLQVFEAMKLYLDAPGFVFVLGWDTEQVLRAVAAEKGRDDRLPQRYVEKIVQFGFRIPRPSEEQLTRLSDTLCEAAGLTESVLAQEHRELLISTTEGNPRQLKRFINRFILLHETVGATTDAAVVIQLMVLQASYDGFFRLLANVPGDADEDNPLFEFAEYAAARQAQGRGQLDRVAEILTARGYRATPESAARQFEAFEQNLPADYPSLVTDSQFSELVLAMSDDVKRELRRLARSDESQVTGLAAEAASKVAAPYGFEPAMGVMPGTTVLWVDDEPNRDDHALLPPGVNLMVATSTDEAKRLLAGRREPISLLISDVGRGAKHDAGLEGLKELRDKGIYDGPAVFYTLRPTSRQVDEASSLNAAITSSPDELRSVVQQYLPPATPQAQTDSAAAAPTSTATSRARSEA
jgi:KAP family P-loop domain